MQADTLAKGGEKLLDYGALGVAVLALVVAVIVLAKRVTALQTDIVALQNKCSTETNTLQNTRVDEQKAAAKGMLEFYQASQATVGTVLIEVREVLERVDRKLPP